MSDKDSKRTLGGLTGDAVEENSSKLGRLLANVLALYVKTKTFTGTSAGGTFAITPCCAASSPDKSLRCLGQRTKGQLC